MREVCGPWSWGESSGKQIHKDRAVLAASGESPWEEAVRQRGGVLRLAAAEGTVGRPVLVQTPDYKL